MQYRKNAQHGRNKLNDNFQPTVTDLGTRKISNQNFSRIVALPKAALVNCGNPRKVNVKLVEENGKKCIMLTPVPKTPEEEMEDKMPSGFIP